MSLYRKLINISVLIKLKLTKPHFKIGKSCYLSPKLLVKRGGPISCGNACSFADGAVLIPGDKGFIKIGNHVSVGLYNVLDGTGGLTIKDNVRIGAHVCIYTANHNYKDPTTLIKDQGLDYREVIISEDCWIGANVSILAGVHINKGSVVAAGSVVNKDVPSYSVVAGVPAKAIKNRQ